MKELTYKNKNNFKKKIRILIIFDIQFVFQAKNAERRKKKVHNKSLRVPTRRYMLLSYRSHS